MYEHGIEYWRTVALTSVAIGQTVFVLLYMTFPWFKTFLGKALFYKAAVLAVLVDVGLFARLNPDAPAWNLTFTLLYTLLGVGVWVQFFAFLQIRTEDRGSHAVSRLGCEDPPGPHEAGR